MCGALLGPDRHGMLALGESPTRALDACAVAERQAQIAWLMRGGRV